MMQERTRPRIAVIGTGGTLSAVARDSLDHVEYDKSGIRLSTEELVARVPEVTDEAEIVPLTLRPQPSTAIGPADWLNLDAVIHRIAEEHGPLTGIVITHGTATLEETAYFLNLTLKVDVTVVLAASQRPFGSLSTDANLNLVNAIRVAAAPTARGLGVLVLLNDEIQAAREVTKGSTYRLEAFRSPDLGMLGYADPDGRIEIYRKPTRRHAPDTEFDIRDRSELPRVDIAYSYAGADGTAIDAFVAAGTKAIVLAGFAPGGVTPDQKEALAHARERGVLVVQSTRAGSGRVLDSSSLREQAIIPADNLNPQKARVLTMLALTVTDDLEQCRRFFQEY